MRKKNLPQILAVALLTLIALIWRLKWWPNYVSFGFEQARDALAAQKIYSEGKLTLIGPTTEIEGMFHGPLYYYLIGLPYFIFGKNPASVSLLHILFNIATIPVIYYVGKRLFNIRTGIIAALFYIVSYEVASYGLWLSNPSPGLAFIILAYFFCYRGLKENQKYLPLAFLFLSISVQFDLIAIMHIVPFSVSYFVLRKPKLTIKTLFFSFLGLLIPLSNYPLFETRHDFLITRKFLEVFSGQDAEFRNIFEYLIIYINKLAKEFANVLFPIHGFLAGMLMFILITYLWRKIRRDRPRRDLWLFISVWLFSAFPTFLISAAVTNSEFAFFGTSAAIVIIAAAFLDESLKKRKFAIAGLIFLLILLGNYRAWIKYYPNPQKKLFDAQRGAIMKDTLAAVDYTYYESNGKPFFIDAVTIPLFISPLWKYQYDWYGQKKYGYLPSKNNDADIQFLIIEPSWGDTYTIFRQRAIDHMNETTKVVGKENFGMIVVEKRCLLNHEPAD